MKLKKWTAALCLVVLAATAPQAFREKSSGEKKAKIQEMRGVTLNELYNLRPDARDFIKGAEGYAVFSTKGMKVFIAGGTEGKGILVDQKTGQMTYMKMAQVNVGLGYGLQDARLVFVFQDRKALEGFATQGWDFSGKADLAASAQGAGGSLAGAVSFLPGVLVYQFTKNGLAASITLQGTKFWTDEKLNS